MACTNTTRLPMMGCCGGPVVYSALVVSAGHTFVCFTKGAGYALYKTLRTHVHWHFYGTLAWRGEADLEVTHHFDPRQYASQGDTTVLTYIEDTRQTGPGWNEYYNLQGPGIFQWDPADSGVEGFCGERRFWREFTGGPENYSEAVVTFTLEDEYVEVGYDLEELLDAVDLMTEDLPAACGDKTWTVSFDGSGDPQTWAAEVFPPTTPWNLFTDIADPPLDDLYERNPMKRVAATYLKLGGYTELWRWGLFNSENPTRDSYDGGGFSGAGVGELDFIWGSMQDGPYIATVARQAQKARVVTKNTVCVFDWRFGRRPWPLEGTGRDTWEGQSVSDPGTRHCDALAPIAHETAHPICPVKFGTSYLDFTFEPTRAPAGGFAFTNDVFGLQFNCEACP